MLVFGGGIAYETKNIFLKKMGVSAMVRNCFGKEIPTKISEVSRSYSPGKIPKPRRITCYSKKKNIMWQNQDMYKYIHFYICSIHPLKTSFVNPYGISWYLTCFSLGVTLPYMENNDCLYCWMVQSSLQLVENVRNYQYLNWFKNMGRKSSTAVF